MRERQRNYGGLICPACGAHATGVIDGRPLDEGTAFRRRRECGQCGHRFTTYERVLKVAAHIGRNRRAQRPEDV